MLLINSSLHGLRWFNGSLLFLRKFKLLHILVSTQTNYGVKRVDMNRLDLACAIKVTSS